ncbi:MAG TPA: GNAT family N-acetyltransferase [Pricia sp.]|nr:GNAT family N-acetyltransferase [Pricia sp.]
MIRKATLVDKGELQELFVGSILEVCKTDYTSEQLVVWSSGIKNKKRWQNILTNQVVLVSEKNRQITGFCTLDGNHIDLFYVHKDHQRKGIAKKLYTEIEKVAKQQGQNELTSNVSKTARAFFEKIGFNVVNEQTVQIENVKLTNFEMAKKIM